MTISSNARTFSLMAINVIYKERRGGSFTYLNFKTLHGLREIFWFLFELTLIEPPGVDTVYLKGFLNRFRNSSSTEYSSISFYSALQVLILKSYGELNSI